MTRSLVAVLRVAVLLAVSLGCATGLLHERAWLALETPHFQIASALSAKDTGQLARDLESFHGATEFLMGASGAMRSPRTSVYAYDGRGIVRPFAVRGSSGYFLPSLRGGVIVLRTGGGWRGDANPTLRHDFAHWLFRQRDGLARPLWYDEGFARLASTTEVKDGGAQLGVSHDVQLLRDEVWIPISRLVRMRDLEKVTNRDRRVFAAESWALVHYLYLAKERPIRGRARMRHYFDLIEASSKPESAFLDAFGTPTGELQSRLTTMIRGNVFGSMSIRSEMPWEGDSPPMRPLPQDEANTRLGWLSIVLGRPEQARAYFERAVALRPDSTHANLGLGAVDKLLARWEEAKPHFARALSTGADDPIVQLEVGGYYHARAGQSADASIRAELARLARSHYEKSLALDGGIAETHAVLGASYLLPGEDASEGLPPLLRAQQLLSASLEIELLIANLKVALGLTVEGRRRAVGVYSRTHSNDLAAAAQRVLEAVPDD